jgi:hypothetical protein
MHLCMYVCMYVWGDLNLGHRAEVGLVNLDLEPVLQEDVHEERIPASQNINHRLSTKAISA